METLLAVLATCMELVTKRKTELVAGPTAPL